MSTLQCLLLEAQSETIQYEIALLWCQTFINDTCGSILYAIVFASMAIIITHLTASNPHPASLPFA